MYILIALLIWYFIGLSIMKKSILGNGADLPIYEPYRHDLGWDGHLIMFAFPLMFIKVSLQKTKHQFSQTGKYTNKELYRSIRFYYFTTMLIAAVIEYFYTFPWRFVYGC